MVKQTSQYAIFYVDFLLVFFEEIFGEKFVCEETKYVAKQNSYCEFKLTKVDF